MTWHTGTRKNSLCYFAESNAKALLTQVSKVHCALPGAYKGMGKSHAFPYTGSACYATDRSGVDGTNCILQSEIAYAIMSLDRKTNVFYKNTK